MTKLTLCMPTYNGERFVAQAVRSLLFQENVDFECIVSDDASTDRTVEIVQSLVGNDPRFRIVVNPSRLGLFRNPAQCLALARGEYVQFLPQDDLLLPGALKTLSGLLDTHPDIAMAWSALVQIDAKSRVYGVYPAVLRAESRIFGQYEYIRYLSRRRCLDAWVACMMRRACVERIGGFQVDLRLVAAADLGIRLNLRYPILFTGQPLVAMRFHEGGFLWQRSPGPAAWLLERNEMAMRVTAAWFSDDPVKRFTQMDQICETLIRVALETSSMVTWYEMSGAIGIQRLFRSFRTIGGRSPRRRLNIARLVLNDVLEPLPLSIFNAIRVYWGVQLWLKRRSHRFEDYGLTEASANQLGLVL